MTFETFCACLDKLPTEEEVVFSGFAEPWLNPLCTAMLRHAERSGRPICVFTTLVGMAAADYEDLAGVKTRLLCLHLPDAAGNAHFTMQDEKYRAILARALADVAAHRLRVDFFSCHGPLHPEIREAVLACCVPIVDEMHDRAGNVADGTVRHVPRRNCGRIVCTRCHGTALDQNVLLPDGTVLLCCMDYGMEFPLGNLLEDSWNEIAEGAAKRRCRAMLESEAEGDILCRTCLAAKKSWQYRLYSLPGVARIWNTIRGK